MGCGPTLGPARSFHDVQLQETFESSDESFNFDENVGKKLGVQTEQDLVHSRRGPPEPEQINPLTFLFFW